VNYTLVLEVSNPLYQTTQLTDLSRAVTNTSYTDFTQTLKTALTVTAKRYNTTLETMTYKILLLSVPTAEIVKLPDNSTAPAEILSSESNDAALAGISVVLTLLVCCCCCCLIAGLVKHRSDAKLQNVKEEDNKVVVADNNSKPVEELPQPTPAAFFIGDKEDEWDIFYLDDEEDETAQVVPRSDLEPGEDKVEDEEPEVPEDKGAVSGFNDFDVPSDEDTHCARIAAPLDDKWDAFDLRDEEDDTAQVVPRSHLAPGEEDKWDAFDVDDEEDDTAQVVPRSELAPGEEDEWDAFDLSDEEDKHAAQVVPRSDLAPGEEDDWDAFYIGDDDEDEHAVGVVPR